jgi:hypothetical protein
VLNSHETVALSSVIHILAFSALPTLQSSVWEIIINGDIMEANVQYARVWTSIAVQLCLICSATILLTILNRRKSGLCDSPGGFAGLASLICDSETLLAELRSLPACATRKMVDAILFSKWLQLRHIAVLRQNGESEVVYQIVVSPDDAPVRLKVPSLPNRQSRFDAHPIAGFPTVCLVRAEPCLTLDYNFPGREFLPAFALGLPVSRLQPCRALQSLHVMLKAEMWWGDGKKTRHLYLLTL